MSSLPRFKLRKELVLLSTLFLVTSFGVAYSQSGVHAPIKRGQLARRGWFETKEQVPRLSTEWMRGLALDGNRSLMKSTTDTGYSSKVDLVSRLWNGWCRAVAVEGNIGYFGMGGYLEIVDFSDPANPIELGKTLVLSPVYGVAVSGSYAYVAEDDFGFRIIDVSNPAFPTEAGYYDTKDHAMGVAVSGPFAYVANGDSGLCVIDVFNPASPFEVGSYDLEGFATGVAVSGSYAYIANYDSGLCVIDVSNPASPTEVGDFNTGYGDIMGVAVSGSYVYIAEDQDGLRIIDVSNPALPTEVGYYDTKDRARGVAVSGFYAYVADEDSGLCVIDVSNPASPTEAGNYDTGGSAFGVAVSGFYAYVADTYNGLRVIDVSNPAFPTEAGYYDTGGDPPYLQLYDVAVSGSYAYIADELVCGLRVIDISNPASPTEVGSYHCGYEGWTEGVAVNGFYAYIVNQHDGLRVIDVFDPAFPTEIGYYDTGEHAYDVAVSGSYVYVATAGPYGLRIIDVSNPASPVEVGYYDTMSGGVAISGSYAYVTSGDYGFRIIDVSNPAFPTEIGYYDTGGTAINVAVSGSYAYVADGGGGLRVINVSNPAFPTEVGYYDTRDAAYNVAVSGSYAYVANLFEGLCVIDVSNPTLPTEAGYHDTWNIAYGIAVDGLIAYVADAEDGLWIFDASRSITPACAVSATTIDCDTVVVGTYVDTTFSIKNIGGGVLTGNVNESCDCFNILFGGGAYALAADESLVVGVRFEPDSALHYNCTIETGGSCDNVLCTGVGEYIPVCEILPTTFFSLGTVTIGTHADTVFTIKNTGLGMLSGTAKMAPGLASDQYKLLSSGEPVDSVSYNLATSESLLVGVRFEPDSVGTHVCGIETGSDYCYDVVCIGTAEVVAPDCSIHPAFIDFDTLTVGSFKDTTFTIKNTGGGTLTGSVMDSCLHYSVVSGDVPIDSLPYSLAPAESLVVTVRFEPDSTGEFLCIIETGDTLCTDVSCVGVGEVITSVTPDKSKLALALYQNHPNPFNPMTTIRFDLPHAVNVKLAVYNVRGELVATVVDRYMTEGSKEVTWKVKDNRGKTVPSGVYFYRLKAGKKVLTKKMVLLK